MIELKFLKRVYSVTDRFQCASCACHTQPSALMIFSSLAIPLFIYIILCETAVLLVKIIGVLLGFFFPFVYIVIKWIGIDGVNRWAIDFGFDSLSLFHADLIYMHASSVCVSRYFSTFSAVPIQIKYFSFSLLYIWLLPLNSNESNVHLMVWPKYGFEWMTLWLNTQVVRIDGFGGPLHTQSTGSVLNCADNT